MVRKIKKIVRVKKKQKVYNFDDDTKILSSKNTYRKTFTFFILIAAFLVVHFNVFSPTKKLVNDFKTDFQDKENKIKNFNSIKAGLIVQSKKIEKEYQDLRDTFFKLDKSHEFFTLIANSAINNQLKIIAIQKVSEGQARLPKPGSNQDAPADQIEYDYFPNFTQASFKIDFEGSYLNYMDFINDLKKENKSLIIENSLITKKENNDLAIKSTLSINYTNTDV